MPSRISDVLPFFPGCGSALDIQSESFAVCNSCGMNRFFNSLPAVVVIVYNTDSQVLVIHRSQNPRKGWYDFPGGFVDYNESVEQAAVREMQKRNLVLSYLGLTYSLYVRNMDHICIKIFHIKLLTLYFNTTSSRCTDTVILPRG